MRLFAIRLKERDGVPLDYFGGKKGIEREIQREIEKKKSEKQTNLQQVTDGF